MKMFLLIAPLGVMLTTTMSASAQGYPDAGLNRLDDPNYGFVQSQWRRGYGGYDGYAGNCRVIRERIVLPDGREIYSSRQICGQGVPHSSARVELAKSGAPISGRIIVDMDLRVKPRDPEASIRVALRGVQCPRCNGHGRPRIIGLAQWPSI